jgi:hypothetical protein
MPNASGAATVPSRSGNGVGRARTSKTPASSNRRSDAEIAARSTKRGAWIAAVASLVTSVIAVVGALYVSTHNATQETDRSRAEFLRSQQRDVYTKLIQDENELFTAEIKYLGLLGNAQAGKSHLPKKPDFFPLVAKVTADSNAVDIVGSPLARERVKELRNVEADFFRNIAIYGNHLKDGTDSPEMLRTCQDNMAALQGAQKRFTDAARKDMGAE